MTDPIQMTHLYDQLRAYAADARDRFPEAAKSSSALALAYSARMADAVEREDLEACTDAMVAIAALGAVLIRASKEAPPDDPILTWIRNDLTANHDR
jgi:hypothetical protein